MNNNPELKLCPFCGGIPVPFATSQNKTAINCYGCGLLMAGDDCLERWNYRIYEQKPVGLSSQVTLQTLFPNLKP